MISFWRLLISCMVLLLTVDLAEAAKETPLGPKSKTPRQQKSDAPPLVFISALPREKETEPDPSMSYRVTLRCNMAEAAREPTRFASILKKLAVRETVSISLFLTFHTGEQKFKPDRTPEAPEGVLSTFPVFIYNAGNSTIYYNGFGDCNRTFLLNGNSRVYVNPVFQVSKTRCTGARL